MSLKGVSTEKAKYLHTARLEMFVYPINILHSTQQIKSVKLQTVSDLMTRIFLQPNNGGGNSE